MRPTIFFLAAALLACAAPAAAPEQNPILASEPGDGALAARCQPPSAEAAADTAARIAAGRYVLTLVANDRSARPARAHGPLWLLDTSDADRSHPTGRGPAPVRDVQEYLYGAVSLDFRRIGASVPMVAGDTISPAPTSTDPIRPGVLVSRSNGETVVLISTLGNIRDGRVWLDGAGIGLHVRQVSHDQFSGIWSGWGSVRSRQGFFCAARTSG
jgi:hypothetical protein